MFSQGVKLGRRQREVCVSKQKEMTPGALVRCERSHGTGGRVTGASGFNVVGSEEFGAGSSPVERMVKSTRMSGPGRVTRVGGRLERTNIRLVEEEGIVKCSPTLDPKLPKRFCVRSNTDCDT